MSDVQKRVAEFRSDFQALRQEIGKVVVGNQEIVDGVLTVLFAGGNCLLEGVPGLGKTLLVRTLSQVLDLHFSRIQFTPDLMPADIIGTNLIMETPSGERMFKFQPGPLFAQILLADEINRATPKTQSALLEAMQEHTVTIGGTQHRMSEPFFVMATQNPIEMEGTYPLPEAQLDRFFFKLLLKYSTLSDLKEVLGRTTDNVASKPAQVIDGPKIEAYKSLVKEVVAAPHIKDYVARIILATHPKGDHAVDYTNRFVRFGSSPRGAQCLVLAAKVRALLDGRYNVSFEDVRQSVCPSLRHRLILNFEGEAEGIEPDNILARIVEQTPTEPSQVKEKAPVAATAAAVAVASGPGAAAPRK